MPRSFLFSLCIALVLTTPAAGQSGSIDEAFRAYWEASNPGEAAAATQRIIDSGASFHEVWARLRSGKTHDDSVPTGRLDLTRRNPNSVEHPYTILVPNSYDPDTAYQVRVFLHGGVARPAWESGGSWWRNYDARKRDDAIAVFPASWSESIWWSASQVENLSGILDRLKRTYNVDENRVYMFGISDGGSGAYFHAFRAATPWAAFLPFIAHPAVMGNPRLVGDEHMFVANLTNRRFYIVNGEIDRLYPVLSVEPFVALFRQAGTQVVFRPQAGSGHNMRWWPSEAAAIDAFIEASPRRPLPNRLTWETERTDRSNRHHWLVITELGAADGQSVLDDFNELPQTNGEVLAFFRSHPSGRVEVTHRNNTVTVRTEGVRRYKLLLSPDQFDFDRPIRVITNGRESFNGVVARDVATLLRWAARDNDRTMLFGAELEIDLGN